MSDTKYKQLSFEVGTVFTPGSPVNERELFAGRIDQVLRILDAISQRGYHVMLYGERGVGKTSLSNVLSAFLHDRGAKFLLPRINCDASDDYSSLWRKLLRDVVVTESKVGVGFNADQIEIHRSVIENLPEKLTPDDVRRTLENLARGINLVPVFDEFDRVTDETAKSLMADTIKLLSDYSIDATVIMIGVADSVDELIGEHQSIERALVQVPMPRMTKDETCEIIKIGLSRLSMTASGNAVNEIADLSQGIPYITHLVCLHSARHALDREISEVRSPDLDAGIQTSLEQWQQSIKSAYYHSTKSQQPDTIYREVLLACALAETDDLGYFSAADVRNPLRQIAGRSYDIPNFSRHLKEFSEEGRGEILSRVGEKRRIRYRFNSPLMIPYIVMRGYAEQLIDKDDMTALGLS